VAFSESVFSITSTMISAFVVKNRCQHSKSRCQFYWHWGI